MIQELNLDKVIAVIPTRMNGIELKEWKKCKFFNDYTKITHDLGTYTIYISMSFDTVNINVRGFNGISMGYIKIDNGYHGNETYSLSFKFINKLTFIDPASNFDSIINTTLYIDKVKFGDEYHFTFRMILDLINESWNKIFNHHK